MKHLKIVQKNAMKVIGIEVRTSNKDEADTQKARIPQLWQRFFQEDIVEKIPHKAPSGHILAMYTDYKSDEHGPYTAVIGCEVTNFEELPQGLVAKMLPESSYALFTTQRGPLTTIVGDAWKEIWQLRPSQLGGSRRFSADFEMYTEKSLDPQNAEVDIYIAIEAIPPSTAHVSEQEVFPEK